MNGADPWLMVLMALLTFLLVITIGYIISHWGDRPWKRDE